MSGNPTAPSDSLGLPPFSSPLPILDPTLLSSFFSPSNEQSQEISQQMTDLDSSLLHVDAQIAVLQSRRAALERVRAIDQAFLSPIRRIPPEILSEILIFDSAHAWLEHGLRPQSLYEEDSVECLFSVCRLWRTIAERDARIWAFVDLNLSPFRHSAKKSLSRLGLARAAHSPWALRGTVGGLSSPLNPKAPSFSALESYGKHLTQIDLMLSEEWMKDVLRRSKSTFIVSLPALVHARLRHPDFRSPPTFNPPINGAENAKWRIEASSLKHLSVLHAALLPFVHQTPPLDDLTVGHCRSSDLLDLRPLLERFMPDTIQMSLLGLQRFSACDMSVPARTTKFIVDLCDRTELNLLVLSFLRENTGDIVQLDVSPATETWIDFDERTRDDDEDVLSLSLLLQINPDFARLRILSLSDLQWTGLDNLADVFRQFSQLQSLSLHCPDEADSEPSLYAESEGDDSILELDPYADYDRDDANYNMGLTEDEEWFAPLFDALRFIPSERRAHLNSDSGLSPPIQNFVCPQLRQLIVETQKWKSDDTDRLISLLKSRMMDSNAAVSGLGGSAIPTDPAGSAHISYVRIRLANSQYRKLRARDLFDSLDKVLQRQPTDVDRPISKKGISWIEPHSFEVHGFVQFHHRQGVDEIR